MAKQKPTSGGDDLDVVKVIKRVLKLEFQMTYKNCKAIAVHPGFRFTSRAVVAFNLGLAAFRGAFYLRDYAQTGGCDSDTTKVCAPHLSFGEIF